MGRGAGRKIVQNAIFCGKRHDNKILKVKILLSRNFVVMAQAPKEGWGRLGRERLWLEGATLTVSLLALSFVEGHKRHAQNGHSHERKKHPKKICIKNFGGTLAGGSRRGLRRPILYVGVGFPSRIQCIKNFEGGGV